MPPLRKPPTGQANRDTQHDRRTALVRDMIARENAHSDAKTAKLRALRLAKEAEDLAAGPAPVAVKPRRAPAKTAKTAKTAKKS